MYVAMKTCPSAIQKHRAGSWLRGQRGGLSAESPPAPMAQLARLFE
jgi:hypothetical protein